MEEEHSDLFIDVFLVIWFDKESEGLLNNEDYIYEWIVEEDSNSFVNFF